MTRFPARWAKKRDNAEERFHMAVADYLRQALPRGCLWTTIPTVGSSMFQGVKLKRKGYRAGTHDLVICYEGVAHWLELKTPRGSFSFEQVAFARDAQEAGCKVGVARKLEDVEHWLRHWAIPLRATLAPEPASVKAARETA